ncbi:MAG: sulfatase [Colwellia sp.]|nr:sulfatase [Colwellia sp.]
MKSFSEIKYHLLYVLPLILFISSSYAGSVKSVKIQDKTNVIIIVADQMRRAGMGFWSQPEYQGALNGVSDPVVTPNIDRLAAEGVVFNQAISNYPLCSPFRAMLMSGMYPNKNGVAQNTHIGRLAGLKPEIKTLTNVLFEQGYNTALFGKVHWHVNKPLFDQQGNYQGTENAPGGHYIKQTNFDTYVPPGKSRHGIEYWFQNLSHVHKNPLIYSNDPATMAGKNDGQVHTNGIYSAVGQADRIIEYLQNNRQQRDTEKPFSILWTMEPPHGPYESLNDTDEQIYNTYYKDKPIIKLLNRPNIDVKTAEKFVRYYFSMITLIDREIGRVLTTLKSQGLEGNTIVIFTADHGEMMGSHGKMSKNVVEEESLSIPFILKYPLKLSHRIDDLMFGIPDIMPTLLGLLNLGDKTPDNIDGVDYSSIIIDPKSTKVNRPISSLYYGKEGEVGVRTARYTYALNNSGQLFALYDNVNDPYQMNNLELKDIPKKDRVLLNTELACWLQSIDHPNASLPSFNRHVTLFPINEIDCHR